MSGSAENAGKQEMAPASSGDSGSDDERGKQKQANVKYYALVPNRNNAYYQPVYVMDDPFFYPSPSPMLDYEPTYMGAEEPRARRRFWILCGITFVLLLLLCIVLSLITAYATPHGTFYRTHHYHNYYVHCNIFTCHRHYY